MLLGSPGGGGGTLARSGEGMSLPGCLLRLDWGLEMLGLGHLLFGGGTLTKSSSVTSHKSTVASSALFFFLWSLGSNCFLSDPPGDAVLCLALHLGLKCSEIVPSYDDFRSKAPLVFSEHMANACVMFNYKPVFDGWAGPS